MKKTFGRSTGIMITLICILLYSASVYAQKRNNHDKRRGPRPIPSEQQIEKKVAYLSEKLTLSKEQEKQISDQFVAHSKIVQEKHEKQKAIREAFREEMKELRISNENKVKTSLTNEQLVQFDAIMKEQKPKRGVQKKPKK